MLLRSRDVIDQADLGDEYLDDVMEQVAPRYNNLSDFGYIDNDTNDVYSQLICASRLIYYITLQGWRFTTKIVIL